MKDLITEPTSTTPAAKYEVEPKPPIGGATPPPTPKSEEAVEHGKAGAEFGKLGGRPPKYLRVCPSCGFKGKAGTFGKIPAGE